MPVDLPILYEDEDLIAVNKPSGLPCYPLRNTKNQTVAHFLETLRPQLRQVGLPFQAGLIHRLDNDTSGILIAAKNQTAYGALQKIWNTSQVTKTYQALVLGRTQPQTITTPI